MRKIGSIDAMVIRIGGRNVKNNAEEIVKTGRNVVLLARGKYITTAVEISNQLCERGYELFSQTELEFCNPEIGTWHFEKDNRTVSLMRIWLKEEAFVINQRNMLPSDFWDLFL